MEFVYHNPTQIHFGQNSLNALPELIPAEAKILVLYGGGSIKANGVYQEVSAALRGHTWLEFGGIEPNPSIETLRKAIELVRAQHIDFILAVGGGSVIDGAKLVAAASHYQGDAWDLLSKQYKPQTAIPLGVVLTLAATGSESNMIAVISNKATQEKRSFYLPITRPRFALLNPVYLRSLPARQLQNSLVDAFVHVCEQYLTYPAGGLVQEGYALAILKTLRHLAEHYAQHEELWWCENLMWAANQALCGIVGVGMPQDWGSHRIGVELTALYGIDHARTLSIIQPALLQETIDAKRERLAQIAQAVFQLEGRAQLAIDAIRKMYIDLEMPTHLHDAKIIDPNAPTLILNALRNKGLSNLGTHADLNELKIARILQAACCHDV